VASAPSAPDPDTRDDPSEGVDPRSAHECDPSAGADATAPAPSSSDARDPAPLESSEKETEPLPSENLSVLAAENARLRAELDTTTAALADAVAAKFAAERVADVASRASTHYGRMSCGRTVTVTREVADDLRNQIETQNAVLKKTNRDYELATRALADARRAHAAEVEALREALDDAISETARANMECDVLRLKMLDAEDDEEEKKKEIKKNEAPFEPSARMLRDETLRNEKNAREALDVALREASELRAAFSAFKETSSASARALAETRLRETSEWRKTVDEELETLRASLEVTEKDLDRERRAFTAHKIACDARDEAFAETLAHQETLERDLDRASRALKRKGAVARSETIVENSEKENAAPLPRAEARARTLANRLEASATMHARAVAGLRAEHAEAISKRDGVIRAMTVEDERRSVDLARCRRRSAAFEKALYEVDASAAVSLAAALEAKESITASMNFDDPASRVAFADARERSVASASLAGRRRNRTSAEGGPAAGFAASARPSTTRGSRRVDPNDRVRERVAPRVNVSVPETKRKSVPHTEASVTCAGYPGPAFPPLPVLPPEAAEAVSRRLRALETCVVTRERRWRATVRDLHIAHEEERTRMRRACVAAVDAKNAQIKTFREKLNSIAATLRERAS